MLPELKAQFPPDCPYCHKTGQEECLFAFIANYFATNTNLSSEQKHQAIATARESARKRRCNHLNDIDPNYEGKESL